MSKFDKLILAIKKEKLFGMNDEFHFQGFCPANKFDFVSKILNNYEWLKRGDIEDDPKIKHPISYCVIVNPIKKKVFSYIRANKDEHYTEKRLHGMLSIGVGGHIEKDVESNQENPIVSAMLRELEEEVTINGSKNPKVLGYINDDIQYEDDTTENKVSVGRVHFGLLYLIETDAEEVFPNDSEIAEGRFRTIEELEEIRSREGIVTESWSEIALEPLKEYFNETKLEKKSSKSEKVMIGITGTLASGKSTIAEILTEKGFKHYSVRNFLIDELKRRGLQINRENMVLIANDLRKNNSPSYIIEKLYTQASESGGNAIIESIRNPREITHLKGKGDFHLIAIDAEPKTRYDRSKIRSSETDNISFENFLQEEQKEMESEDPNKQNIRKCIEMANFIIDNEGNKELLKIKITKIIEEIRGHIRPSWDEYFLEISKTVAKRATCDRGRSGCVIVKDKQILVTGYVGSPVGMPHCDDVGHQMKSVIHEDGTESRHCMRTAHSEQNAICQAAKLGISISNSTIYCKMTPCTTCTKMIINSGIKRVVCEKRYHAGYECEEMFRQAEVKLEIIDDILEDYKDQ